MNSIGFKNFRRFQNFPEIDLGDITILVGGNNAGKSTLVKAILLMRDFLKRRIERVGNSEKKLFWKYAPQFSFDTEHVNVGDFYRAFCRQSPVKDNTITFSMKIDKFRFVVNIRGERKPGIIPRVSMIAVSDEERDIHFEFDFSKGQMTIRFEYDKDALNYDIDKTEQIAGRINRLKDRLSQSRDFDEISNIKIELENLERMSSYANASGIEISEYDEITIDISYFKGNNVGNLVIPELIRAFVSFSETGSLGDKRSRYYADKVAKKNFIRGKASEINRVANEVERVLNGLAVEYIYAHSVYQDSVYANCANSSDYTKRTIHEFYTSRISKGDDEFTLIENWLKEFGIGKSLKVVPFKGDNYTLTIYDGDNSEGINNKEEVFHDGIDLADKGMGSIQVVILLLRIATLIRKYKGSYLTILLEEPEQNLHPVLQSKLANLIFEINKMFGVKFILETHSEYLVRRTQVLAARQLYEEEVALDKVNESIKVYFLSQERGVVDMLFLDNAKFQDSFDEGFFDQAARESLTISRLERVNKNK